MSSWIAVSKTAHGDLYWKPREHFHMFSNEIIAPVVPSEMGKLLADYVLGFVQENGLYRAIAILGIEQGSNLFVSEEGKWQSNYVPAAYRGFPFGLGKGEDGDHVFCIEESYLSEDNSHQRFFDEEGNLTQLTTEVLQFLQAKEQGMVSSADACKLIESFGLLKEWELVVPVSGESQGIRLEGLFCVDEEKLNSLGSDKLGELRQFGALAMCYAQLLSTAHTDQLAKRFHLKRLGAEYSKVDSDVGDLFSSDDTLNFDNI